jgi:Ca-activated chloride channel family protein
MGNADVHQKEDNQAIEQWLRRIPDDPGGLLRRKFAYQYQQRQNQRGQQ